MTVDSDVLIIGGGVAGLSCAHEAVRAGFSVTIVESAESYGGASAISGGGCCIVGTPLQRAHGIADGVEVALRDWAAAGGPTADLAWARRYLEASAAEIFTWLSGLGVIWQDHVKWYVGNSVARWHRPEGGGGAVISAIRATLGPSVTWVTGSPAVGLLRDGDRVTGATVLTPDGRRREIRAGATVVATGGFTANREMLAEHGDLGNLDGILSGSSYTATGSGHVLLREVGAAFANLGALWIYPFGTPNHRFPDRHHGIGVRGLVDQVWVNRNGERFWDENARGGGEQGGRAILSQPGREMWAVFDSVEAPKIVLSNDGYYGIADFTVPQRRAEFYATSPHVRHAASIGELARAAGLPAAALEGSIAAYNDAIRRGLAKDPLTGRELAGARAIDQPPFTALLHRPMVQKCFGGVRTDLECRVLTAGERVIPGLYAAGEVAGMAGGHINGVEALEGTMFGPCLYSGRVAGRAIAAGRRR